MKLHGLLKQMTDKKSKLLKFALFLFNHLPFNNKFKIRKNKFSVDFAYLKKCKVNIYGVNNKIIFGSGCKFSNCKIEIRGNNNTIIFSEHIIANYADFYIEDDNNEIVCKENTSFAGKIHLACTEGSRITVGSDCLFSSGIVIRTGDSHSIVNMEGNRINPAKDVIICDHVWVGYGVLICKGAELPAHSVVGTGSVVTHAFRQANSCIAGNPAKIVKEGIDWYTKRI